MRISSTLQIKCSVIESAKRVAIQVLCLFRDFNLDCFAALAMTKAWFTMMVLFTFSLNSWALTCKQSEIIPLEKLSEQTETLAKQFARVDHIETLPQKITPQSEGFTLTTVQVLVCGELIPQSPTFSTTPGQACQFDSNCAKPMRCQNNQCMLPG